MKYIIYFLLLLNYFSAQSQPYDAGDVRRWTNGANYMAANDTLLPAGHLMTRYSATTSINAINASILLKANTTDVYSKTASDGLYYPLSSNPANYLTSIAAQSFASLTGKPTTLAGYGITNAYPLTGNPSGFLTSEVDGSVTNEIELPSQTGNAGRDLITNGTSVSWGKRRETYSGTTANVSGVDGRYVVTFATAFSVAPNIQANIINGTDTQNIRTTAISTTGFTVLVRNRTDVIGLLPTWAGVNGATVDITITEK